MGNTIFLTKDGLVKLEQELKDLKGSKRLEIAEKLKEAISFWDLSENSEYEDARNEQAQVELRISELEDQLKKVEIIKDDNKKWENVNMGSIVEIQDVETKEKEKMKIVGSTESDILADLPTISNESLVGKTLLWKKKGDTIEINSNRNIKKYKILNIK